MHVHKMIHQPAKVTLSPLSIVLHFAFKIGQNMQELGPEQM